MRAICQCSKEDLLLASGLRENGERLGRKLITYMRFQKLLFLYRVQSFWNTKAVRGFEHGFFVRVFQETICKKSWLRVSPGTHRTGD